jgi:hypothetical protein
MSFWKSKNKYNATAVEVDNMRFDSKLEAKYFTALKAAVESGRVVYFLRQVPFHLPGKSTYRCDFQIFWPDGLVTYVDVKGKDTPMSKLKRKQVEELYPVQIDLVNKAVAVRRSA